MQSDSDSENEFFDASEKLNFSGSFSADGRYVARKFTLRLSMATGELQSLIYLACVTFNLLTG